MSTYQRLVLKALKSILKYVTYNSSHKVRWDAEETMKEIEEELKKH
jgi:hypothetical protein